MGLDADGDPEPPGQRHARLQDPGRGAQLLSAGQRAAEHPDQRGFPVAGQFEEPAQVRDWIGAGQAHGAVHRDDRQPGRGHGLPDPSAGGGGHPRVDELAVDEPQLDAAVAHARPRARAEASVASGKASVLKAIRCAVAPCC